jgi:AraC-like DNA-binding protein
MPALRIIPKKASGPHGPGLKQALSHHGQIMNWMGNLMIADGVGVFRGSVGDNRMHRHWAAQISVALEDTFDMEIGGLGCLSLQAAYFRPNVEHRLVSGKVCSLYFDPASPLFNQLVGPRATENWGEIALTSQLRSFVEARNPVEAILKDLHPSQTLDSRIPAVLAYMESSLDEKSQTNRTVLAKIVGMSPSRFSHWFVEQLGIPVRSYIKWLKLRLAINAMLAGESAVNAALAGGFSDQAHMSRGFANAFGITYMSAQAAITSHNKQ